MLVYNFLCVIPTHCRPNHKGNICVFKACASTTHSSDTCLRKQRLCSYRKASGCGKGGFKSRTSREGCGSRGGREGSVCRPQRTGAAVVAREGGRAAMVAQAHIREGVRSHLQCLSVRASGSCPLGHLEDNSPSGHDSVSPLCVIC